MVIPVLQKRSGGPAQHPDQQYNLDDDNPTQQPIGADTVKQRSKERHPGETLPWWQPLSNVDFAGSRNNFV